MSDDGDELIEATVTAAHGRDELGRAQLEVVFCFGEKHHTVTFTASEYTQTTPPKKLSEELFQKTFTRYKPTRQDWNRLRDKWDDLADETHEHFGKQATEAL